MTEAKWCPGRFVWYELYTPEIATSKAFYEALVGWKFVEQDLGPMKYTVFSVGEAPSGGFMPLSVIEMQGVPPFWMSYVSVPSVDESAAAAKRLGGKVFAEPRDIPGVGRFSVLQDPQGAVITAYKGTAGDPPEVEQPPPGSICWNDLQTTDTEAAAAFYAGVFGWVKGPFQGNEQMPVFFRGSQIAAGMMKAPPGTPAHWLNFLAVENLAQCREKAKSLGAKILVEEVAVPGVGKFCVLQDNVGAAIALFQGT